MFDSAVKLFAPRRRMPPARWMSENVRTPDGRPFDLLAFPYFSAPGGPCDALADPAITTIWLQFASRVGKTFFALASMHYLIDQQPGPAMSATESEKLAGELVARHYALLEQNRRLARQLRPKRLRRQDRIDFDACTMHQAWARSVSTLADKPVRWGHANEIDKWLQTSTSKEADPLKLFDDRFKEFNSFKRIKESTPTIKGASRIERGIANSDDRQYYVPCPKCGRYQTLTLAHIEWEKLPSGKSDPALAGKTAYYRCLYCPAKWLDHHRARIIRAGVWVPAGCTIDDARARKAVKLWPTGKRIEYLQGKPLRAGADAGFTLSSLYHLSLSWGRIAAEFVSCHGRPQDLRNFINQWLAQTWELVKRQQTWEQLGQRCISPADARERVPQWASLLTLGIDRQQDRYVWSIDAWSPGPEPRVATIAYGDAETLAEIHAGVLDRRYAHADGGEPLPIGLTLIDSGYRPTEVYAWCALMRKRGLLVWPCKGSSTALNADCVIRTLGENTTSPGVELIHVDTMRTNGWLERQLYDAGRDEPGGYQLHAGSLGEHEDFLTQLLNEHAVLAPDKSGQDRESWQKIDPNIPNDFRDTRRYAYAAKQLATRGGPVPTRQAIAASQKPRSRVVSGGSRRPDGRPWI